MKQIHPWLRNLFYTGCILSLVAGIQLFILSEHTDTYFAWTIQSPLTAATLGAFYFGTMVFGFLSGRETLWANVRGPAIGLFVFLLISLLATLLHLDKFHLTSQNWLTLASTWVWMLIYGLLPPLLMITFILQSRMAGRDPERTLNMPSWIRGLFILHGAAGIALGLLLFLAPQTIIPIWPWALTPLTARALSAWLISFGIVDLQSVRENDWRRLKVMSIGYIIFGSLAIIAMFRYASEVNLLALVNFGYLAYLLIMLFVGIYGYLRTGQT